MAIFEISQSTKPEYASKQIQLLVRVIIESGSTGCEFSVLTTVSPKERIANVHWRKLLCSESTPDLVIFYPHK